MESWKRVWRDGVAPQLSGKAVLALAEALLADDPRLIQGATTSPPPILCVQDWPVEAACLVGFCAWQGDALATVGEVEQAFGRLCYEADQRLKEPAACRWLMNWFDETPRDLMRRELFIEVERTMSQRGLVLTGRPAALGV